MSELLSASYLHELDALRRRLRVRTRSENTGDHLSRRRGSSAEFLEHRDYAQGDDPRRIDWLAFARTGTPVLKLFRAEEDVLFRLFVDASASLSFGAPTKIEHAKRIAASLGYLALASNERAQIVIGRDVDLGVREPCRGKGGVAKLLRELDSISPMGGTDLPKALTDLAMRAHRPGFLLIVSDFLDAQPLEPALMRLGQAKHEMALVHVLEQEEIEPSLEGDIALVDSETGALVEMTMDDRALALYRDALERHVNALRASARRIGATYVRTLTTESPLEVMKRLLKKGVD